jgi:hypothetical protein
VHLSFGEPAPTIYPNRSGCYTQKSVELNMVQTFIQPETISLEVLNSIALRVEFYRQQAEVEILINPA